MAVSHNDAADPSSGGSRASDHGSRTREVEPATEPLLSARREERVLEQVVPGTDPRRTMFAPERQVGVAQDRDSLLQDVVRGIAAAKPRVVSQAACTTEVDALLLSSEVVFAVVLVKRVRSSQPQVSPAEEVSIIV